MTRGIRQAWRSPWPIALGLTACYAVSSVALLTASPLPFQDGEALHNATVARELLAGNGRFLLDFQYRPNCGGCTFLALIGALMFRGFGITFLVWKALPIAFGSSIVALGCLLLDRNVGRFASLAFGTLVIGSPVFLQRGMLMAWGTHFEVMVFVLVQALIVSLVLGGHDGRRWTSIALFAGWGLIAGFGLWFCFSSAFAFPALWLLVALAGPRILLVRRLTVTLPGLLLGASPLLLFYTATGTSPFEITTQSLADGGPLAKLGEVTLARYVHLLYSVGTELTLRRMGVPVLLALWSTAMLGVVAPILQKKRTGPEAFVPFTLLLAAVLCYVLSGFQVDPVAPGGPPPIINLRYLHPAVILLLLSAAAGMGMLWKLGPAGGLAASLLLVLAAGPGVYCRLADAGTRPADGCHTTPQDLQPFDYHWFAVNRLGAIEEDRLLAHAPDEWTSRVNHRRTVGARRVARLVSGRPEEMPQLLAELRALPGIEDRDVPALLHGLGLAVPDGRPATAEKGHRLRANVLALLDAANPEERRAFAAAIWPNEALLEDPLVGPTPRTAAEVDLMAGWAVSTAECAICPAIGARQGPLRDPRELRSLDDLLPRSAEGFPTDRELHLALIEGRASEYGRAFGYCDEPFESFAAGLAPADREAALAGFALGRARHWMVDVQPGAPPELVP